MDDYDVLGYKKIYIMYIFFYNLMYYSYLFIKNNNVLLFYDF